VAIPGLVSDLQGTALRLFSSEQFNLILLFKAGCAVLPPLFARAPHLYSI